MWRAPVEGDTGLSDSEGDHYLPLIGRQNRPVPTGRPARYSESAARVSAAPMKLRTRTGQHRVTSADTTKIAILRIA